MKNESTVVERIVTTTDSGTLSRYWIISAMVGLLFSSVTGLLVSLERIDLSAANIFSTADEVFQFWSAHRVSLVLIAVLPLMIGLALPKNERIQFLDLAFRGINYHHWIPRKWWGRNSRCRQ